MSRFGEFTVVSQSEAKQSPYPYVYVNDDGSVRELHVSECQYLEESFSPFDGDRPYVKASYDTLDGWNSIQGFCKRSAIPNHLTIKPAPLENPNKEMSFEDETKWLVDKMGGAEKIIEREDGVVEIYLSNENDTETDR